MQGVPTSQLDDLLTPLNRVNEMENGSAHMNAADAQTQSQLTAPVTVAAANDAAAADSDSDSDSQSNLHFGSAKVLDNRATIHITHTELMPNNTRETKRTNAKRKKRQDMSETEDEEASESEPGLAAATAAASSSPVPPVVTEPQPSSEPECVVCEQDTEELILTCKDCGVKVHPSCYGIDSSGLPGSGLKGARPPRFQCVTCAAGERDPVCRLCGQGGVGAYKTVVGGGFGHVDCAIFLPEFFFVDETRLREIDGFEYVGPARRGLTCRICKQKTGYCVQCCYEYPRDDKKKKRREECLLPFHVSCAKKEGRKMGYKIAIEYGPEVEEGDGWSVVKLMYCPAHSSTPFDLDRWMELERIRRKADEDPTFWKQLKKEAGTKTSKRSKGRSKKGSTKKASKKQRTTKASETTEQQETEEEASERETSVHNENRVVTSKKDESEDTSNLDHHSGSSAVAVHKRRRETRSDDEGGDDNNNSEDSTNDDASIPTSISQDTPLHSDLPSLPALPSMQLHAGGCSITIRSPHMQQRAIDASPLISSSSSLTPHTDNNDHSNNDTKKQKQQQPSKQSSIGPRPKKQKLPDRDQSSHIDKENRAIEPNNV